MATPNLAEAARLLNINPDSGLEEMRRFYRIKAMQMHPDMVQDSREREKKHHEMSMLSAAKSLLEEFWQHHQSFGNIPLQQKRDKGDSEVTADISPLKSRFLSHLNSGEEAVYLYYLYNLSRVSLRYTSAGRSALQEFFYLMEKSIGGLLAMDKDIAESYSEEFYQYYLQIVNFFKLFRESAKLEKESDFHESQLEQKIYLLYNRAARVLHNAIWSYLDAKLNNKKINLEKIQDALQDCAQVYSELLKKFEFSMWIDLISIKGQLTLAAIHYTRGL